MSVEDSGKPSEISCSAVAASVIAAAYAALVVATEIEDTATAHHAGALLDGARSALLNLLADEGDEFEPAATIARVGDARVARIEEAGSALLALVPDEELVTVSEELQTAVGKETHLGALLLQLDVVVGAIWAATAHYATGATFDETARQAWEILGDMGVGPESLQTV